MAQGWAFISNTVSTPVEGKREQIPLSSGCLPLLHRQSQLSAALASWMACGCLWEESRSKHFEHYLGTATCVNLLCTILCFCIQLQPLFGTKLKDLEVTSIILILFQIVTLELDLCLLYISVSHGISEAKAALESQVKSACERLNTCVFFFSLVSPVNCSDKTSTLVAHQLAVMQWFRADPLTGWAEGLHTLIMTPAANPPPSPSGGLQLPSLCLAGDLDLWLTWFFLSHSLANQWWISENSEQAVLCRDFTNSYPIWHRNAVWKWSCWSMSW